MVYILKKYASIPIETIVIPYARQISLCGEDYKFNIVDFQLLRVLSLHPKVYIIALLILLKIGRCFDSYKYH
jgi:hypothetical protein